ncbi:MAG: prephenate dehydratase [Candidatus Odinarchaeum yellowstonii]|uniref:prephenate dehydratase n=1 Tax=Odinarchaeota yellowstonii (strain LCB_4) TaxID=1841599 RepID=A0AAF0D2A2_ODILC|nr:MAG: prephenate dehydratase [Candidatus Odinarchaeum yellowstonii]
MVCVAFQGERGAYSEEAALEYFGREISLQPCYSFQEVFERVVERKVDYGVIPIENSYTGSIVDSYDLLLNYNVNIIGEKILKIKHNLIANKGVKLEDISEVYAHPQAIAQCDIFLKKLGRKVTPFYDTAGGVKYIKEKGLMNAAAIASRYAAEIYDMNVLVESIESFSNNYTRFYIISLKKSVKGLKNKTTLVFSIKNVPGSLYNCLKPLAEAGLNLTKIESRPDRKKPWEYVFYLDFEGVIDDPTVKKALTKLEAETTFLKILGSYPADTLKI